MVKYKVEVFKDRKFWHILSHNGQILLSSECYSSGAKALEMAKSFQANLKSSKLCIRGLNEKADETNKSRR